MTRLLRTLVALLAFTSAAEAQWIPTAGPLGSTFHSLAAAADGVVLGASSAGALFRFDGADWTRAEVATVRSILASGSEVFVDGGDLLFRSANAGASFEAVAGPPSGADLLGLDEGRVFAGRLDTLYLSHDRGTSWESYFDNAWVTIELPGQPPTSFAVGLHDFRGAVAEGPAVYVAATAYIFGDVYRLAPGDSVWTPVVFRETVLGEQRRVTDLVRVGERLLVASDAGVHASDDGGQTWVGLSAGLDPAHTTFGGDLLVGASALFGHFGSAFYRLDGTAWTLLEHPPGGAWTLADAAGDRLLASMPDAVLSLEPSGWQALPRPAATSPILMHADGTTVIAAAGGRLHRTDDAGASWNALPLQGLAGWAHVGPAAMLAAVQSASGLARSSDGGQTWTTSPRPPMPASVGTPLPRRFVSDASATYIAYAHERRGDHGELLSQYGGVFRTGDGGASWTDVSAGLPTAPLGPFPIGVLFSDGSSLITQAGNGACLRRMGGPWQSMSCPGGTLEGFAAEGGTWFALTTSGVLSSTNQGSAWTAASTGVVLPPNPNQHALFWLSADLVRTPAGLLLTTQFEGVTTVYRWEGTWAPIPVSFPTVASWTGFAAGSDALFGGARDAGVWRLPLDVLTGAEPPPAGQPTFMIDGPRPNPARAHVVVEATLSVAQPVRAEVLDATGRRVVVFHDGRLGPGMHRLGFDASALAAGVYVVRVSGADVYQTRRLAVYR